MRPEVNSVEADHSAVGNAAACRMTRGRKTSRTLLAPRHWGTISEAGLALAVASLATRLLPFNRYIDFGARPPVARPRAAPGEVARIVDAIANRVPFRAVCLQRGLVLQWMLRRRGVDAVLHYGIELPEPGEEIRAHVWVSADGEVLIGAPQHEQYAEVARYPQAGA